MSGESGRKQNRKQNTGKQNCTKVADIHKLFCDAVIKLRPGMSAQAAALSLKTEFDTDHNGARLRAGNARAGSWALGVCSPRCQSAT